MTTRTRSRVRATVACFAVWSFDSALSGHQPCQDGQNSEVNELIWGTILMTLAPVSKVAAA
jgi:hypothetical protein